MTKLRGARWAGLLLLCAAGMAGLVGWATPAAGDGPYFSNLPVTLKNRSLYAYVLQPGSPTYLSNFINQAGCNWFGVVGRVFGHDSNPVLGLSVHFEGGGLNTEALTGTGPSALGPGSYEIPIADHPLETTGVYFVQLRTGAGSALSDVTMIPTHAWCSMNLVLVNFVAAQ